MLNAKHLSFFWKVVISILICELTGVLSSLISLPAMYPWFDEIRKPEWNPPPSVFGPVWTTLYLLMGISLALVWRTNTAHNVKHHRQNALWVFAFQLFLNFWWSIVFFKFHSPQIAFIVVLLMDISIIITIFKFSKYSKVASWLLVPYISWVCFATLLNFSIWQLNK